MLRLISHMTYQLTRQISLLTNTISGYQEKYFGLMTKKGNKIE